MAKLSAGLLVYRLKSGNAEVFLVHPGGPFWARKDEHAWSIPKGEYNESEDGFLAATREFSEEVGQPPPVGKTLELGIVKQKSGKVISAWAIEGEPDPTKLKSNKFEMEWPPKSGHTQSFPEVDKAAWFDLGTAKLKIHKGQIPLLEKLEEILVIEKSEPPSQGALF